MASSSSFASQFPEAQFRDAILNTMLMGMPENVSEQLTWRWNDQRSFTPHDEADEPYDWSADPVTEEDGNPDVPSGALVVPYALEFSARPAGSMNTELGEFDTSRAVVTLLDDAYEQVRTADFCTLGDSVYKIQFVGPSQGLFAVTVYTVYLIAEDES